VQTLSEIVASVPRGTRYVLSVLKPSRELVLDEDDLRRAARALGAAIGARRGDYAAIAGLAGEPPALVVDAPTPFERSVDLSGVHVSVRMESWLDFDTIRRMGFGQVIAARRHTLIIERGVSFVAFDSNGRAIRTLYAANIFAPQPRYLTAP
jgi:hypothetical protein